MAWRILVAGIVGGLLLFVMGAVNHTVLGLQTRTFRNVPESATFIEHLSDRKLPHGMYVFPDMPTAEQQSDAAKWKELNERYKAGPSGLLLVDHTGEDMMSLKQLALEFATNVLAATMAAWIVSLMAVEVGIGRRWFAVLLIGLITWLSISASYGIWYRFPHDFVHDDLFCAGLEWAVAGVAIAAIVRRRPTPVMART